MPQIVSEKVRGMKTTLLACVILVVVSSAAAFRDSITTTVVHYRHDLTDKRVSNYDEGSCLDYSEICTSDIDCCEHLYLQCAEQGECRCSPDYVYNTDTLLCYYQSSPVQIIIVVACAFGSVFLIGGSILLCMHFKKRWRSNRNIVSGDNVTDRNQSAAAQSQSTVPTQPLPPIGFESIMASKNNIMPVIPLPQSYSPGNLAAPSPPYATTPRS